jgi:hexosaminidase
MKTFKTLLTVGLLAFAISLNAQKPALIPVPDRVTWGNGTLELKKNCTISCANASLRPAVAYLSDIIRHGTGFPLKVKSGNATIQLALTTEGKEGSYSLDINEKGVKIVGNTYRGVINGTATLRQLFSDNLEAKDKNAAQEWTLPYVSIQDEPRFDWRGMELDCSRHFFTKGEVEALLDVLSLYKIDRLHWHLTDDQGWRIEIKKYPLLTDKGAWRTFNNQDSICMNRAKAEDNPELDIQKSKIRTTADGKQEYGGFYTQEDIKEIVEYAKIRGIEIIPEIDMPGHSLMAIANYDGLSCFKQVGWGRLFTSPMCPGKDSMLEFCKNVWSEIFQLFPSKYVHLGGDEVDMRNWKVCPDCQKRMKDNNLKTEPQLQAWFIHYMEDFFSQHGKEMIGWDEIIEGGLTSNSIVMWWRGWAPKSPKQTTAHGNQLICTPSSHFYIDYQEDANAIPKIYAFDPFAGGLTDAEKPLVLGVQGNLWTEWVPTFQRMWYMAFPRMIAIAELGWSKPERMNLQDFQQRLASHFKRMDKMGVTYRIPDLTGFYHTNVFTGKTVVDLKCADATAVIRYTTDGSIPQANSTLYTGPMTIDKTTNFIFRTFSKTGRKGDFVKASWIKEGYASAAQLQNAQPGLKAEWRDYKGADCAGIETAKLNGVYDVPNVAIPKEANGNIGLIITGFIEVPADDIYTFALLSDDGSYLKIDGQMIVDNDSEHSPREIIGQHAMSKGLHPLYVRYFDHNGGQLQLKVMDKNGKEVNVKYFTGK